MIHTYHELADPDGLDVTLCVPMTRWGLLQDLLASVKAQTVKPRHVLVHQDPDRTVTLSEACNQLAEKADTAWVMFMDDDDLFMPDHFEVIAPHLTDGRDVIFSWPKMTGHPTLPEDFLQVEFVAQNLARANSVSGRAAAIRLSLWRELGGYRDVLFEDWEFWVRALLWGAKFHQIREVTWEWRRHATWEHISS